MAKSPEVVVFDLPGRTAADQPNEYRMTKSE
jgi:hypothetical protein